MTPPRKYPIQEGAKGQLRAVVDSKGDPVRFGQLTLLKHSDNGKFYVRMWDSERKGMITRSLKTDVRKVAEGKARELDRQLRDLVNNALPYLRRSGPQETIETVLELSRADADVTEMYRKQLARWAGVFLDWRNTHAKSLQLFSELSQAQLNNYIVYLKRKPNEKKPGERLARNTIISYLKPLQYAHSYMSRIYPGQVMPLDFATGLPEEQHAPEKHLSWEQVLKVWEWASQHPSSRHRKAAFVVGFGASSGLRLSEMARIKLADFDGATLTVPVSKTPNGERIIPLTKQAIKCWQRFMQYNPQPVSMDQPILPHPYTYLTEITGEMLKEASYVLQDSDLRQVAPHEAARATFCALMDNAGLDDRVQDALIGHAARHSSVRRKHYSDWRIRPDDLNHIKDLKLERLRPEVEKIDMYLHKNLQKGLTRGTGTSGFTREGSEP